MYKASHFLQYPVGTQALYSYVESRGGLFPETLFFGLQKLLLEWTKGVSRYDVLEAADFFAAHGEPFPLKGWTRVVEKHGGALPIVVKAIPEGTRVLTHNVLATAESTDPELFWIVSWLETQLLRAIWYPTTVATLSLAAKKMIYSALQQSDDDPDGELLFRLHDFGARGVSSSESASIGGAAHLVNFMGSDTVEGVLLANRIYKEPMAGFSIPAAEHSTITAWGREHEVDAYRNMLHMFAKPGSLVAVVSDSYDIKNAVERLWGHELKQAVIDSGATVIIRPDSGNPPDVVAETLKQLRKAFGVTKNSKGYDVLNNVRVIQGDGINLDSIDMILKVTLGHGFSARNVAFGMGGGLLQQVNRDTLNFAMKCSAVKINGVWHDVYKEPTASAMKKSKRGKLSLIDFNGTYETIKGPSDGDILETVFSNGAIKRIQTFSDIRKRAWKNAN